MNKRRRTFRVPHALQLRVLAAILGLERTFRLLVA
jgi:hypothetical protein